MTAQQVWLIIKEQWLKFFSGLAQALVIFILFAIILLVTIRGLSYFWPKSIATIEYLTSEHSKATVYAYSASNSNDLNGRIWLNLDSWTNPRNRTQIFVRQDDFISESATQGVARIDFKDGRFLLARPVSLMLDEQLFEVDIFPVLQKQIQQKLDEIDVLNSGALIGINRSIAQLRAQGVTEEKAHLASLNTEFVQIQSQISDIQQSLDAFKMHLTLADGSPLTIGIQNIRLMSFPNDIGWWRKLIVFKDNLTLFLTEDNRSANQAGGVFPAIFGTILMVFLMTIIVSPLGIMAAIYLTEYAPNNAIVGIIRLAVSNLAAVPSVVYGVFGLGFLVYQLGGSIDSLFYSHKIQTPTFGTPGLLWASLTMSLLTLPVVIVATEEGLRRVPGGLRKASYALGATRYETIRRIVLPVASSSLMTGIILAIARAAGEVAPMLMVGAVKYAPELPVDGQFPFLHLERQFMHLGVLIYDGAFHGQSTQQGAGIMFASCLFLLTVVLLLNFIAIAVRARLQSRYGY